jgi:hypothetical protein
MIGHDVSNDPSAANQNTREEMTCDALQSDPWSAIYLPLPPYADQRLLTTIAVISNECAKSAFAAARVSEIVQPGLAGYYKDRQADAIERRDEARQKLRALAHDAGAQVTPFLDRDFRTRPSSACSTWETGGSASRTASGPNT